MSATYGEAVRLTLFGESRGVGIGGIIDGLPAGFKIDVDACRAALKRRKPGGKFASPRDEPDEVVIQSGLGFMETEHITTGTPLAFFIKNEDKGNITTKPDVFRPSHADFTAHVKYGGYADLRGGGHFSGRLTATMTFAGEIARQFLKERGIRVQASITSIGEVVEPAHFEAELLRVKTLGDSVGMTAKVVASGVPVGIGEPIFGGLESVISHLL